MAYAYTSQWVSTAPQAKLTITTSSETATTLTLAWSIGYVASSAASTSSSRTYTLMIGSKTVKTGSYNINGVTGSKTIASGTYTIDKTTSTQTVSCVLSFDFKLTWSGSYAGTKSCTISYTIPKKTSYSVKYNANGGSDAPSSQTKWHGSTLTLRSDIPTRTGHTFEGWGTSASATTVAYAAGASYTSNKSITLYAIWTPYTYSVKYNANGGSGAPSAQTKTYGVTLKLSNTEPTRANHAFMGWGTSASATAVAYEPGANYSANDDITLYAIWELNYAKPRITNYSITRCDSSGDASDNGTYALVKFSWACDRTLSSIVIECIDATSNTTSTTVAASGTSGSVNKIIGGALSNEATYTIRVVVTDALSYSSSSKTLNGIVLLIDCLRGGNGIAFGKPAQMEGYADFGWDVHFDNTLAIAGRDLEGNIKEAFQPQNNNGNTVIGWGNYNLGAGNTNIYGHDINFGVSNIAEKDTFRPYRRQGDSITLSYRGAGYVTNSSKDVSFVIPLTMPVIGSPTVTVTSVNGFTLRQGNKYTHGSSAEISVYPDSYEATLSYFLGIHVTATFSDTTNVTNNDAIGIYWNGTITFT